MFGEGLPIPEQTVRAAFTAAVDTITIHGDDEPNTDLEQRLDALADRTNDTVPAVTLVPARARRIDDGIARLARAGGQTWPPTELASMDKNPGPSTATPKEAGLAAVSATITGHDVHGGHRLPAACDEPHRRGQPDCVPRRDHPPRRPGHRRQGPHA